MPNCTWWGRAVLVFSVRARDRKTEVAAIMWFAGQTKPIAAVKTLDLNLSWPQGQRGAAGCSGRAAPRAAGASLSRAALAQAGQQPCGGLHKLYTTAKGVESTNGPVPGDRAVEQVVSPQRPETSAARHTHPVWAALILLTSLGTRFPSS